MKNKLRELVNDYALAFMITGAVIVALIMVTISMSLYISSGAEKLDLSRPGYEKVRAEVNTDTTASSDDFSASGPLDTDAIKQFQKAYDSDRAALNKQGSFSGDALSDKSLNLSNKK